MSRDLSLLLLSQKTLAGRLLRFPRVWSHPVRRTTTNQALVTPLRARTMYPLFRVRVPGDNFYRYEATVSENPIITKALTSCVAYGLGDLTAQLFTVSHHSLAGSMGFCFRWSRGIVTCSASLDVSLESVLYIWRKVVLRWFIFGCKKYIIVIRPNFFSRRAGLR